VSGKHQRSAALAAVPGGGETVRVQEVTRTFGSGRNAVHALRGVSFTAAAGQLIALCGRSGSGKTTLLNIIAGLDQPSSGRVWVGGQEVTGLGRDELLRLRREKVGLVFQTFALLPILSAAENVGVPMRLAGVGSARREQRARDLLRLVGLAGHEQQRPFELSGGEQQRVAIARALANNAGLLLADEPTGQLDSVTGEQIMKLLRAIVRSGEVTAIVATHDRAIIDVADRVLLISNGGLREEPVTRTSPAGPGAPRPAAPASG
jgi:putative ABC transport system ATP-binding protein